MKDRARISANSAPADAVLPEARADAGNGVGAGTRNEARVGVAMPDARAPEVGVVMLDTRFPRFVGDVGNPANFGARRVLYRVVPGAWPREVVTSAAALRASPLAGRFVDAVLALEAEGARVVTTSCGFLVLLQRELQSAARVPVVSSSLLLLPMLLAQHSRVGVLTISAANLTAEYFDAAGVPESRRAGLVVQGVDPQGEFASAILGNREAMDSDLARRDVVAAATQLKARAPDVTAIVLECTNMPPYAEAVREACGCRVLSLLDAVDCRSSMR